MNFSSDSDYSDGSTGLSRPVFIASTPKRVLRKNQRVNELRILSPVMPSAKHSQPCNRDGDDKRSMICNGDVRRRRAKFAKVVELKTHRMSLAVPLTQPIVFTPEQTKKVHSFTNFTLDDECESDAPSFQCKICGKTFFHSSAVKAHELLHTSTLPRKRFFQSEQVLNKPTVDLNRKDKYMKNQMDRLRTVPTETVFQKFNLNLSTLDDEEKVQLKKDHQCQMCGKMFPKKSSMRLHQTKRHIHTREFLLFI